MKRNVVSLFVLLVVASGLREVAAEVIDLTVDAAQSSLTITLLGDSDSSSISGSGQIDLIPPSEPFGTAQFTDLNLVLDDGFFLSMVGGLFEISAEPGDVTLDLVAPGPPGNVDQNNQFQQLGNLAALAGQVDIYDPLNLFFGTGTYDLAKFGETPFDITEAQLSLSGNELTVTVDFLVEQEVSPGVFLTITGTIVLNGQLAVCADGGALIEGAGETGDFSATCASDDAYWAAHGATLFFQIADPVVQFELTATAPAEVGAISVEIEASKQSNNGNLNLRALLFNFTTGNYVSLPGILPLTTTDAIQSFTLPAGSNPTDFIEPGTNEVRLLLQTVQTSGLPNVRTQLDAVLFVLE